MRRSLEKETMDLPGNPPHLLKEDLENLRTLNRALGAYRGVLWSLERLRRKNALGRFSLLDVGAGSGDIAVAIVRWARRRRLAVKIVALEVDPVTAGVARRHTKDFPEISVVRADGLQPPFCARAFDFVFASQLLHHFSEEEIVAGVRNWAGLARRGLVLSDLVRHPVAYHAVRLLMRIFTRNPMTRSDAPLSVQRAFTLPEWRNLFRRAAIGEFNLSSLFPFRMLVFFRLEE